MNVAKRIVYIPMLERLGHRVKKRQTVYKKQLCINLQGVIYKLGTRFVFQGGDGFGALLWF